MCDLQQASKRQRIDQDLFHFRQILDLLTWNDALNLRATSWTMFEMTKDRLAALIKSVPRLLAYILVQSKGLWPRIINIPSGCYTTEAIVSRLSELIRNPHQYIAPLLWQLVVEIRIAWSHGTFTGFLLAKAGSLEGSVELFKCSEGIYKHCFRIGECRDLYLDSPEFKLHDNWKAVRILPYSPVIQKLVLRMPPENVVAHFRLLCRTFFSGEYDCERDTLFMVVGNLPLDYRKRLDWSACVCKEVQKYCSPAQWVLYLEHASFYGLRGLEWVKTLYDKLPEEEMLAFPRLAIMMDQAFLGRYAWTITSREEFETRRKILRRESLFNLLSEASRKKARILLAMSQWYNDQLCIISGDKVKPQPPFYMEYEY